MIKDGNIKGQGWLRRRLTRITNDENATFRLNFSKCALAVLYKDELVKRLLHIFAIIETDRFSLENI